MNMDTGTACRKYILYVYAMGTHVLFGIGPVPDHCPTFCRTNNHFVATI